jgi:hypothetical protein
MVRRFYSSQTLQTAQGPKTAQTRKAGFGSGINSGISALVLISLEADMALDTNLGWRTGADRCLAGFRYDAWLDQFFHFRSSNDSGQLALGRLS